LHEIQKLVQNPEVTSQHKLDLTSLNKFIGQIEQVQMHIQGLGEKQQRVEEEHEQY
jgi:hypothetical protein